MLRSTYKLVVFKPSDGGNRYSNCRALQKDSMVLDDSQVLKLGISNDWWNWKLKNEYCDKIINKKTTPFYGVTLIKYCS